MKKRILIKLILLGGVLFLGYTLVFAAGPANIYQVTLSRFEMHNGSEWVTLFSGSSTTMDIASVSAGAVAGNFLADLIVPDGTYSQVRVTPSATFTIKGNDGSGRYTTATIGANGGCVYSTTASNEASCKVTISGGVSATTYTFTTPIKVTNNVPSHKVRVNFDVSTSISYNGAADELFPAEPTVTITQIAL